MFLPSRVRPLVFSNFSTHRPITKHHISLSLPHKTLSSITSSSTTMSQTIEHIVLFNVKDGTDPSKINSMIGGLNALISLENVVHLTAGAILRNRSSSFKFTHMLHSRYPSKEDLSAYSANPDHVSVVKSSVFPICEDIMAVDWVAAADEGPAAVRPGSAMRVTLVKMKDGTGEEEKAEVLEVIGGSKERFGSIERLSFGENFSPARAKGFSIGSIAVFPGLKELEALDLDEEKVRAEKEKVRDLLESVIVVDYVVPQPQPANL